MQINFNSRYQGWSGIWEGKTFTLPGFLIDFFFIPIKDPINTSGVEQHNQSNNKVIIVENGTAADDPSAHKNKSIMKKTEKANPGYKNAVNNALINQFELLNIL